MNGFRSLSLGAVSVALAAPLFCGCSGDSDQMKKRMSQLETRITGLQADHDRLEERLAGLELRGTQAAEPARSALRPTLPERPRLKVIKMSPDDPSGETAEPGDSDAEPTDARPVIRGQGDRVIKTGDGRDRPESAQPTSAISAVRDSRVARE